MSSVWVPLPHFTLDPELGGDDRQRDNINNNRGLHIAGLCTNRNKTAANVTVTLCTLLMHTGDRKVADGLLDLRR